ncbi:MAG: site-specific integrase [Alphaproteobacteria bacterium]|nr:site-specific integrase [Alphaproteobacteria bacterium]
MGERKRIGLREVRALQPGELAWDAAVPGFAARRQRDAITYVLKYRAVGGRQRWATIGRHGAPWTPDSAREEARRLLGEVVKGGDPSGEKQTRRKAVTVAQLCDLYLADAEAGRIIGRNGRPKRASTIESDRARLAHIKAVLGSLPVGAVTRQDVTRLMHAIAEGATATGPVKTKVRGVSRLRGGRGVAARTIGLAGAVFAFAVEHDMRADNPVRGVRKFADGRRERRLTDEEYAVLGSALRQAERGGIWPAAVAAARFLVLTGWRSGEALTLRWADVDLARRTATLPDTKTGKSMRPLPHAACDLLRGVPRIGDSSLVFPATRGSGPMLGFRKLWCRIAKLGELPSDVSPHALRHSCASLAADLGYSEPTIAALIGHKLGSVTGRYTHAADAVLLAAADAVAAETAARMGEARAPAEVVTLRRGAGA